MGPTVLCTESTWLRYGDEMRTAAPGVDTVLLPADGHIPHDDLERVEVAFFSADTYPASSGRFVAACLQARGLQWFHTFSAGVDHPVFAELLARGVRLTTSSGASAVPIAHMVMAYVLSLARDLPGFADAQRRHEWRPRPQDELDGSTMVIVGLGPIGLEVARLADAFDMRVLGLRRTPTGDEPCEVWTLDRLPEALERADWLVLALPLTEGTRGLIGAAELARLRPTARLVNVGRGELVDEAELVRALTTGRLAGAGLDVFATEPLPTVSPLWDLPSVIVTPHSSGTSPGSHHRAAGIFLDNLARYGRGEALRNEVRA